MKNNLLTFADLVQFTNDLLNSDKSLKVKKSTLTRNIKESRAHLADIKEAYDNRAKHGTPHGYLHGEKIWLFDVKNAQKEVSFLEKKRAELDNPVSDEPIKQLTSKSILNAIASIVDSTPKDIIYAAFADLMPSKQDHLLEKLTRFTNQHGQHIAGIKEKLVSTYSLSLFIKSLDEDNEEIFSKWLYSKCI